MPSPPPSPPTKLQKVRVMVMDSSEKAAELIKKILTQLGFTDVVVANDGYQGVQILRKQRIDIIFTDHELKVRRAPVPTGEDREEAAEPEVVPLNAVDFVKRLRNSVSSPNPFLPIIMLVDAIEGADLHLARDAGVDEVVTKPLDAGNLCGRIVAIIDKPRIFITSENYRGPCRRLEKKSSPPDGKERRVKEVRIIRRDEHAKKKKRI